MVLEDWRHILSQLMKVKWWIMLHFFLFSGGVLVRASPGAAVKLCLGDLLVMGSNPETASLHMQE